MKKRKILNIFMVAVIIFTALCGVMAVGSIKGWFEDSDITMVVSEKTGIVTIERQGVSYELKKGDIIKSGDIIHTNKTATVNIKEKEISRLFLNEKTTISLEKEDKEFRIKVTQGEVFADTRNSEVKSLFSIGKETIEAQNTVLSLSAQKGAQTIYVFSGNADITGTKIISTSSGNMITISKNSEGTSVTQDTLKLQALNEFQISRLKTCELNKTFCLSLKDLKELEKEREEEQLKSQQALLLGDSMESNSLVTQENDVSDDKKTDNKNDSGDVDLKTDGSANGTTTGTQEEVKEEAPDENDNAPKYCTIEIRCDTILSNMENLTPGKEGFVPANGIILGTLQVKFAEGETVFDVLKRACEMTGVQLEYSYTPMYESYYIEGINNLYESDCGGQSGWKYKVNGWFPNYGCSSYSLKDGDVIVWCYTCNGLGADVGDSTY